LFWNFFGPGWYGDKNVIYRMGVKNKLNNAEKVLYVKTGIFSGVYITETDKTY